jgi:hypothetical protein
MGSIWDLLQTDDTLVGLERGTRSWLGVTVDNFQLGFKDYTLTRCFITNEGASARAATKRSRSLINAIHI